MKIKVLGCSGGIGGKNFKTTSLLVDDDVLIDAGTGVADLSLAELLSIDHVLLTHSHIDHIAYLPLIVDTIGDRRDTPLMVYALPETIQALRRHIFNWSIWPDFTKLPTIEHPYLRFVEIEIGMAVKLKNREVTALPANHSIPAVGFQIKSTISNSSLVFTGDTEICDEFWKKVNQIPNVKYLLIETAFPEKDYKVAESSSHLHPKSLAASLRGNKGDAQIFITHMKPGQGKDIMKEINTYTESINQDVSELKNDHVFSV